MSEIAPRTQKPMAAQTRQRNGDVFEQEAHVALETARRMT
jgi:hypothetical protein